MEILISAVRSLKEGATDFVIKPWHNEKLLGIIKEALRKREQSSSVSHQKR